MTTYLVQKRIVADWQSFPGELLIDPTDVEILLARGYITPVPDDYPGIISRPPATVEAMQAPDAPVVGESGGTSGPATDSDEGGKSDDDTPGSAYAELLLMTDEQLAGIATEYGVTVENEREAMIAAILTKAGYTLPTTEAEVNPPTPEPTPEPKPEKTVRKPRAKAEPKPTSTKKTTTVRHVRRRR